MEAVRNTRGAELELSSPLVREALDLAQHAHSGQLRKDDGTPYVSHPVRVAEIISAAGFDDEVIAAALLHDVVEDTETSTIDIAMRFNDRVAELVAALSDDESIRDWDRRKAEHRERVERAGREATAIYIADKLANAHDLRVLYAEIGERARERFTKPFDVRIALWREDVALGERQLGGLDLPARLTAELDAFEASHRSNPAH